MRVISKKRSSVFEEKINRGDTTELATKKGRQVFRKNRGVTPSVAAPGVTHPSDATEVKVTGAKKCGCAVRGLFAFD